MKQSSQQGFWQAKNPQKAPTFAYITKKKKKKIFYLVMFLKSPITT